MGSQLMPPDRRKKIAREQKPEHEQWPNGKLLTELESGAMNCFCCQIVYIGFDPSNAV